ncbi:eRF1 domain 1-domain-containing protein [Pyronema domesticum]|uniref:Protein DOM34 homolog n=1 Tax=Pyronema omphalodes (strain CBS 100304) TaxID=1076935 RepID=U4LDH3_PYROM|nr:eRF1 domain 1-domain-containing protein [Pyronema domesticum]CCX08802.1 Similar to Protein dom34; acc. no. Q9USL5 [Pyronema omphalodes CBS 100304]
MHFIKKNITKDGDGYVTLRPEIPEDMWHSYNIIRPLDKLRTDALRRVTIGDEATGSTSSKRVHTILTLIIEKIDFDPSSSQLHLSGRTCEENAYVTLGQYHTLDLELHRNFTLYKSSWDSVALEELRKACTPGEGAEIAAITLHEGLATICAVGEHITVLKQRIEMAIPKKRGANTEAHDKGMQKFYAAITAAFLRLFDIEKLKVVLFGSPGYLAQRLREYIFMNATKMGDKTMLKAKGKFICEHTSSGHKFALNEMLASPTVKARLQDTRFAKETAAVERFMEMITTDELRAWYGKGPVERAVEKGAVATLLVNDSIYRSNDPAERKKWVEAKEEVEKYGGEVLVLSSIHESGVRLAQIGGIAAMLSFPLDDLEGEGDADEEVWE